MKTGYKFAIGILIVLFVAFEAAVIFAGLHSVDWIQEALQGAGVFVALIATVIALQSSDREKQKVSTGVELTEGDPNSMEHSQETTPKREWQSLGHSVSPFRSARVHFRLVNESGLTLQQPTLSFRLPLARRHPHRLEDGTWTVTFNSNLYNSQQFLRTLQFAETSVISNSNLPFWNDGDELVIWIRMAIDAPDLDSFEVQVSVNAENAQGHTYKLNVDPKSIDVN